MDPNLRRLGELDNFEVASDDPDVRGWDVKTRDGREVGEVEELIVDPSARKVRYLEVDLNREPEAAVYRTPDQAWGLRVWRPDTPSSVWRRSLALREAFYREVGDLLDRGERRREGSLDDREARVNARCNRRRTSHRGCRSLLS